MYQIALDQIPQEEKNIDFKVCRDIRNSFVKIGNYRDVIQKYEDAMSYSPDHETGVNALLCYIILGYAEKCKQCFTKIMSLPLNQVGEEEVKFTSERNNCKGGERCGDLLEEVLLCLIKDPEQVVITESLLVASVFGN